MRYIFIITLAFLSGCSNIYGDHTGKHGGLTPLPLFLEIPDEDEEGRNSEYIQGFRDGCNTGMGISGTGMLRFHKNEYRADAAMVSKDYYKGYRMGHNACLFYTDWNPL